MGKGEASGNACWYEAMVGPRFSNAEYMEHRELALRSVDEASELEMGSLEGEELS